MNAFFIEQNDGYSCGLIACLKVMHVFGQIGDNYNTVRAPQDIRNVTITKYHELLSLYRVTEDKKQEVPTMSEKTPSTKTGEQY